ncbi:response regulator [Psychromonas sp. B3M02]|uniref:response regulator n=1 Tax=Psychromonas sp. B3M02 TaxID=2267226 RepID=UPI000DEB0B21|nr:response regulator [Psychromonas sp. B3M02]RBW46128.1 response regulator [Psychromonas sp. B3M02]
MDKLHLVCVDDNTEITFNLLQTLSPLSNFMTLSQCNSGDEALKKMDEIDRQGDFLVLIVSGITQCASCDVPLLEQIAEDIRFIHTKRILISNDTSKEVFINAINIAHVNRFYEQDWDEEMLLKQVRVLVTKYIFAKGLEYEKYQAHLDSETILKRMRRTV